MTEARRVDLVVDGRIATLAGDAGPAWVEAIAVSGGRVLTAGPRSRIEALIGPGTRMVRLGPGMVAIPGLTDAHLHLAEAALARGRVDLEGARSIDELLARVATAGRTVGQGRWLTGGGWDRDLLGAWPTMSDLDRVAPGRRVALWAHDHHSMLASRAALAQAGVDDDRADPPGGAVRRGLDGRATGVLHENAARLVADLVPAPTANDVRVALHPLIADLLALGVVAVHDPGMLSVHEGLGPAIAAYRALAADGELGVRAHACVRPDQLQTAVDDGLRSGAPLGPDPLGRLRMGWLKTFADGSLGSRTAALLEPLETEPDQPVSPEGGYGTWMTPPAVLRTQVSRAASSGIATQIHAIGDAAVAAALDILAPTRGATALMPRIEHAQLIAGPDVGRFAALGIAASVQPVHLRSDTQKARRLWGTRADSRMFPLRDLAESGAVLAFGTDAPVEPIDPWPGIACAVTRSAPSWPTDTPPVGPANAVGIWRAIRAACLGPAISAGESDRGRLVAGCKADLAVIPAAAVAEPVEVDGALWHARPTMVMVDGTVVAGG
jgi:predicted amidohydrolase YtcJ